MEEEEYNVLKQRTKDLYQAVDDRAIDEEEATKQYYAIEEELEALELDNPYEFDLSDIKKQMKTINAELDLFDQKRELDMMFPNRNDDDDDEMSGDSFFKD